MADAVGDGRVDGVLGDVALDAVVVVALGVALQRAALLLVDVCDLPGAQDDLTDATRWAIDQGIADPSKICIYGASYGGYAALMGVAREPTLYRCAVGYVGVYDLPRMISDDSDGAASTQTWLKDWVGDKDALAEVSPVNLADRIKVPVFLASGGKDTRAPPVHTERMEKALKRAGVPVETLYYDDEGHGYFADDHRREYYRRLLAFLAPHLGGQLAK